ncbi:MAG: hypothetical protein MJ060_05055 [Clostridia bacterium]|nr:hypothetical protein [Clostridia bacterium]
MDDEKMKNLSSEEQEKVSGGYADDDIVWDIHMAENCEYWYNAYPSDHHDPNCNYCAHSSHDGPFLRCRMMPFD